MKLIPLKRLLGLTAVLASVTIFSVGGVAYAQYGGTSNGSGATDGSAGASQKPDKKSSTSDIIEEPMDSGYVDQEKRVDRASDPASPSPDTHVPKYPVDQEGKPIKDPEHLQGGPIGPN